MKTIITVLLGAFVMFTGPILGVLVGCLTGGIVGLFFDHPMEVLRAMGMSGGVSLWEVGGLLGFVSGFFKDGAKAG